MKKGMILRIISIAMFGIAIIFISCALANPTLGSTFYIGNLMIGAEVWRTFYAIYSVVMCVMFLISFFVDKPTVGIKAGILKILVFIPVLLFAFVMGMILILEFSWWKLFVFLILCIGIGNGVYYLFRMIEK